MPLARLFRINVDPDNFAPEEETEVKVKDDKGDKRMDENHENAPSTA